MQVTGGESLAACTRHPYMARLHYRLCHLLQPVLMQADLLGEPHDTLAATARALAAGGCGWGARHEALLCACFLEFFREALTGHEAAVVARPGSGGSKGAVGGGGDGAAGAAAVAERLSHTASAMPATLAMRLSNSSSVGAGMACNSNGSGGWSTGAVDWTRLAAWHAARNRCALHGRVAMGEALAAMLARACGAHSAC